MDDPTLTFSVDWDPHDPSSGVRPPGDLEGVLQTLEDDFVSEIGEGWTTLGARAILLGLLDRPPETVAAAFENLVRVTDSPSRIPETLADSRFLIGHILVHRERFGDADEALSQVSAFYESDEDPLIRAVAVRATAERIRALYNIPDFGKVADVWEAVLARFAAETETAVRREVAAAGVNAALGFLRAQRHADCVAACDQVIGLYRSDTDPEIRGRVTVAMMRRFTALPKRRVLARKRALQDLLHFVGSNPEPEVVEAIRGTSPPGTADRVLRKAHDAH